MLNFAQSAWSYISSKFGSAAKYAAVVAQALKLAIAEKDVVKIKAHNGELREVAVGLLELCDFVDEAISDDTLDLYEGAQALSILAKLVDEAEDVITGVDEDDAEPGVV